jgi:hypothetical protein
MKHFKGKSQQNISSVTVYNYQIPISKYKLGTRMKKSAANDQNFA